MSTAVQDIIIDCDPGIDDAIALMVTDHLKDELNLIGVTTVAGNVGADMTYENARGILHLLGRDDVPVRKGCLGPMLHPEASDASHVHGSNGLGDVTLDPPSTPGNPQHSVDYLIEECLKAEPGVLTLCPVGPLTNIALALVKEPAIILRIKQIVLMGGAAFVPGNVNEAAEFNIWADPIAAEIVFRCPVPIVMIGLDVTLQVSAPDAWIETLKDASAPLSAYAVPMLLEYQSKSRALHDPCVPVYLARPDLFGGSQCRVSVDLAEGPGFGETRATPDPEGNVTVLTAVHADAVRDIVRDSICRPL